MKIKLEVKSYIEKKEPFHVGLRVYRSVDKITVTSGYKLHAAPFAKKKLSKCLGLLHNSKHAELLSTVPRAFNGVGGVCLTLDSAVIALLCLHSVYYPLLVATDLVAHK